MSQLVDKVRVYLKKQAQADKLMSQYSEASKEVDQVKKEVDALAPQKSGDYLIKVDNKFYRLNVYVPRRIDDYDRQVELFEFKDFE